MASLIESLRDQRPGARWITAATAVAGAVAAVLGAVGLVQLPGYDDAFLNVVFGVIALFAIDGGYHTFDEVPLSLQVAQLLAPATTVAAALLVVNTFARERIRRRRARRFREHHVVIGSGESGSVILRALAGERNVVVVDLAPTSGVVDFCDRKRWPLISADAMTEDIIRLASIGRARSVFIGTGSDTRDVAIARRLAREVESDVDTLTRIHVRLDSNEVARALIAHDHELRSSQSHDIDYVSRHDFAAMVVLEHLLARDPNDSAQLIDARFGSEAVFVGDDAVTIAIHDLVRRSHIARTQLGLPTFTDTVRAPSTEIPDDLADDAIVFVGFVTETETLHHTLSAVPKSAVRLVVALVAGGFAPQELSVGSRAPVTFVDPEALVVGREMLDQGQIELMARLIHADYLAKLVERGESDAKKPSHRVWADLSDEIRERNRQQARRFFASLKQNGRRLAPVGEGVPIGSIGSDELEREAEREHELWLEDHAEWVRGDVEARDAEPPTHPHLVPWDRLSETVKEYDRDAVRRRPALAALLGLQIVDDDVPVAPRPADKSVRG